MKNLWVQQQQQQQQQEEPSCKKIMTICYDLIGILYFFFRGCIQFYLRPRLSPEFDHCNIFIYLVLLSGFRCVDSESIQHHDMSSRAAVAAAFSRKEGIRRPD